MSLLPQRFYARDALEVAHDLIGCEIVGNGVRLRITEVEAYRWIDGAPDTANHCRHGKTARNAPMWGPPGHAYVYFTYGVHWMLNFVTDREDVGAAALIRACEVLDGSALVQERRRGGDLVGPGKVAQGLAIDGSYSNRALFRRGDLEVHARSGDAPRLSVGPRIGIDSASPEHRAAPWRVADRDSRAVAKRSQLRVP